MHFGVQLCKGAAAVAPFFLALRFWLTASAHQRRIKRIAGQIFKPIFGNQNLIF
jgi:hypothetical protein